MNLTRRKKVLGLPVGRRRRDWRKIGLLGAGVVSSIVGGAKVASEIGDTSSNGQAKSSSKSSGSKSGGTKSKSSGSKSGGSKSKSSGTKSKSSSSKS